jgi:hypothetical protein
MVAARKITDPREPDVPRPPSDHSTEAIEQGVVMRKCWLAGAVLIVSVTACSDARTTAGPLPTQPIHTRQIALVSFDACGDYLAWVRQAALARVGPYGLTTPGYVAVAGGAGGPLVRNADSALSTQAEPPVPATTVPGTAMPASDGTPAQPSNDHGTNVQEAGVDEGDQTKVDGSRIVTIRDDKLDVVSIAGAGPTLVSSTDIGQVFDAQLLVDGDRAIVYGQPNDMLVPPTGAPLAPTTTGTGDAIVASPTGQQTELVQVDLSKGAVVDRRTVDGVVTAARSVDGTFRFVVSSVEPKGLGFVMPQTTDGQAGATAFNKEVIERSTIDDWLPSITDAAGHRSQLVDCASMAHPAAFSGFDTLTVLTVPGGLDTMTATGLTADAEVTYASPTHLYVATSATPTDANTTDRTDIHRFDIGSTDTTTYQGSGQIDGSVLNQYSMSESGEFLRVATTDASAASSGITVLTMKGAALTVVGKVEGLGPSEQIKAVRYLGDLAYVVTFRRTDPLHVVDLSVPTAPRVLGELTADGYSSYLQPVGPNRLLGIGENVGPSGESAGGLVTLYDTSEPTHPRELDRLTYPSTSFDVTNDPHAFTWDAATQVATATAATFGSIDDGQGTVQGIAIGITVAGDHLREVGRMIDPAGPGTSLGASRTVIAGDRLWAITWSGTVSGHDRATLAAVTPVLHL